MHLLRRGDLATLLAPLAQWVGSDEAVAHTLPRPPIAFLHSRVTLVAFVTLGFLLGMLLTESTVGQQRTTGVGAGTLGSAWHEVTSFASAFANLAAYSITQVGADKTDKTADKTDNCDILLKSVTILELCQCVSV